MSDKNDTNVDSEESEIDENDPYAPQLHYIRMQKRLKKVDNQMNPWIVRAKRWAPILKLIEKSLKYVLILAAIGLLIYWNTDKIAGFNK